MLARLTCHLVGIALLCASCGGATSAADKQLIHNLQHSSAQHEKQIAELKRELDEVKGRTVALKAKRDDDAAELGEAIRRIAKQFEEDDQPAFRAPNRPDPDIVYSIPVKGSATLGNPNALITMVKGFEFACRFCEQVTATLAQLRKRYGKQLRIVYKHYIVHPDTAVLPALAACAADKQGKFERFKNLVWTQAYPTRDFSKTTIENLARKARLKLSRFRKDIDGQCRDRIRQDQAALARVGARGTPSFFINGRFISGAQPPHTFEALIDEELEKAKTRVKAGTKPKNYYAEWILGKGKKSL